jgi:hypothetical protein
MTEQPIDEAQPDQVAPPEVEVSESSFTSDTDIPPELEARYKSMLGDYTRKTQEISELRKEAESAVEFFNALQDEQGRDEALRQLAEFVGQDEYLSAAGFAMDGEDNTEDFSEFTEATGDPRVDQLSAEWEAYKSSQQEQQILGEIESFTDQEMGRLSIDNDAEQRAVLSIAATLDLDSQGLPQIEAASQMLNDLYGEKQKSWIDSKKAPRQPIQGEAATQGFDFNNEDERRAHIAALIEAND